MKAKIIACLKFWAQALGLGILLAVGSIPVGFGFGWGFIKAVKVFIGINAP